METTTLLPTSQGLHIEHLTVEEDVLVIHIISVAKSVSCPRCGQASTRIHSRYRRTLADLPWNRIAVRIRLVARKFFCHNPACERTIFTEPLPQLAARYARKTRRLEEALYLLGYMLGGRAGARVAVGLGLIVSRDTLLRRVRQVSTQHSSEPTDLHKVGVDDWAFRKGHRYGTILVDLERRYLVDLLPDRSSDSLAAWLKQHPHIQIVSRDRANVYAEGARQGAPKAQQVADRWHLLHNLGEAMQRLTARHARHLRQAARQMQLTTPPAPSAQETAPAHLPRAEQRRLERCEQRLALYERIRALKQLGWRGPAIAVETGVSTRTVNRFLRAPTFPARARRRRQSQKTDRYEAYIRERMQAGCLNAAQLYREIQTQGYPGSYTSVYLLVTRLRASPSARLPLNVGQDMPSSRSVAWWMQGHLHPSKPDVAEQQKAFLAHLYPLDPVFQEAADLAQEFARLLKERRGDKLDAWLEKAEQSACKELRVFAQGLRQNLAAVRNAVSLEWSNGQTEGQVNRLKMLKRQMYGRAKFDLLRARVLPMIQAA